MPVSRPASRARSLALAAALALTSPGCGGGDPLPAGGPERRPGGVQVDSVEPAGQDAGVWYTREARVTVRGEAPPGAMVEALRQEDGSLAASTRAGDGGGFVLTGLPVDGPVNLQARVAGRPPGPPTRLTVVRRVSPPDPFVVDPAPAATNARRLTIAGTTEADVAAVIRVEGGSAPVEMRKPAGEARFSVDVPLDRDRTHQLAVTATDPAGNRAGPIERRVVQDATSPPPPSAPVRAVSADRTTLRGQAPDAVAVEVTTPADGMLTAAVAGDGAFAVEVGLPAEGENRFEAVATDAAGNRSDPATLVLVRDTLTPEPPEVAVEGGDMVDGTVMVPTRHVTLVGRAEPGATVEATGPSLFGLATAGADGAFRLSVRLPWAFFPVAIAVEVVDAAGNRSDAVRLRVASTGFDFDDGNGGR